MSTRLTALTILPAAVLLGALATAQARQSPKIADDPLRYYGSVLEELFGWQTTTPPQRVRATLRFVPAFQPEMQLTLSSDFHSRDEIAVLTFRESVWGKITEARKKRQNLSAQEIAIAAGMQETRGSAKPGSVDRWLAGLLDSVQASSRLLGERASASARSREVMVLPDGTHYHLVLEVGDDRVAMDVVGPAASLEEDPQGSPVIRAMNQVRREAVAAVKEP